MVLFVIKASFNHYHDEKKAPHEEDTPPESEYTS